MSERFRFRRYAEEPRKASRHILARVNHPQTNGKLERFYGIYEEKRHQFKSIKEYVQWHSEIKPHLSLNIETPIQAFHSKSNKPSQHVLDANLKCLSRA